MKNEPRESSSTSCSESSTSSGRSEDSAIFFFAGLFVAKVPEGKGFVDGAIVLRFDDIFAMFVGFRVSVDP